jgi:hypothetical protein
MVAKSGWIKHILRGAMCLGFVGEARWRLKLGLGKMIIKRSNVFVNEWP